MSALAGHVLDFVGDPRPQYCLRLDLVARRLEELAPGALLEIGPGAGDLAAFLLARGHRLTLVEPSAGARALLARRFRGSPGIELLAGDAQELRRPGAFAAVIACEVLEHVADDRGLLRHLAGLIAPGGLLVGSVPAFARRFGPADEAVGHLRRYERADLEDLLGAVGLHLAALECYGFPLANLLGPARNLAGRLRLRAPSDRAERSAQSGVQRTLGRAGRLVPARLVYAPALWLQRRFRHRDWGTGWVFEARA